MVRKIIKLTSVIAIMIIPFLLIECEEYYKIDIDASEPLRLDLEPKKLVFTNDSTSVKLLLRNLGDQSINWDVTINSLWLSIENNRSSGVLEEDEQESLLFHVDTNNLEIGSNTVEFNIAYSSMEDELLKDTSTIRAVMYRSSVPIIDTIQQQDIEYIDVQSIKLNVSIVHTGSDDTAQLGYLYANHPKVNLNNKDVFQKTINTITKPADIILQIDELNPATKYYLSAYAINRMGISYSNVFSFNTLDYSTP